MDPHGSAPGGRSLFRLRLAPWFAAAGAVFILVADRSVDGENCVDQYFGLAHSTLLAAAGFGLIGFLLGYEYREDRVHLSQAFGFIVLLGAGLEWMSWLARGCGD